MTEEFIYYLWRLNHWEGEMVTTQGEVLKVISPGERNDDSGPDFFNARIKIGRVEWAGNVEMHVKASDWLRHGHSGDEAYDSVVLHVVYDCDTDITNRAGEVIPCFSVKGLYDESLFYRYRKLIGSREWIPCAGNIGRVSDLVIYSTLERMVVERLERKTAYFEKILNGTENNWEETFYISLARNFGFKTNAQPFEQLARSLPLKILAKHQDNRLQLEALLFGQAGLLNRQLHDDYNQKLLMEYAFLAKKYGLEKGKAYAWKFMRMRPVNFPTIRISQFAALIHKSHHLLSQLVETEKLADLSSFFDVAVSEYWETHYTFGVPSDKKKKSLGRNSFELLLINTIVPFLFVYGRHQGREELTERALLFLQQTKAENNGIIKRWAAAGVRAANAAQSQALLTLKEDYCSMIRCLHCPIGHNLIKG